MSKHAVMNYEVSNGSYILNYDLAGVLKHLRNLQSIKNASFIKDDIQKYMAMVETIKTGLKKNSSDKKFINMFNEMERGDLYALELKANALANGEKFDSSKSKDFMNLLIDPSVDYLKTVNHPNANSLKTRFDKIKMKVNGKLEVSYLELTRDLNKVREDFHEFKKKIDSRNFLRDKLITSLKDQGFTILGVSEDGANILIKSANEYGNTAEFNLDLDGKFSYDYDGYTANACESDIEATMRGLSKVYSFKDENVLRQSNPMKLAKEQKTLPTSMTMGKK